MSDNNKEMIDVKQAPTRDELIWRVLEVKDKLPRRYSEMLFKINPKLKKKKDKIRRVVGLQAADEEITIALEQLVKATA